MANQDEGARAKRPIEVKRGSLPAPQEVSPLEGVQPERKPSREELDQRQQRFREVRRSGPPLPPAEGLESARAQPPDVPATECDESDNEE